MLSRTSTRRRHRSRLSTVLIYTILPDVSRRIPRSFGVVCSLSLLCIAFVSHLPFTFAFGVVTLMVALAMLYGMPYSSSHQSHPAVLPYPLHLASLTTLVTPTTLALLTSCGACDHYICAACWDLHPLSEHYALSPHFAAHSTCHVVYLACCHPGRGPNFSLICYARTLLLKYS